MTMKVSNINLLNFTIENRWNCEQLKSINLVC